MILKKNPPPPTTTTTTKKQLATKSRVLECLSQNSFAQLSTPCLQQYEKYVSTSYHLATCNLVKFMLLSQFTAFYKQLISLATGIICLVFSVYTVCDYNMLSLYIYGLYLFHYKINKNEISLLHCIYTRDPCNLARKAMVLFSGLLVLTVSCNLNSFTKFVLLLCHIPFELLYILYLKMPL